MLARTSLVVKDFFDRTFLTCVATRWAKIQNRLRLEFGSVIALRRTKGPGNFRYTDIAETRGCNPLSTTDHRLFIKGVSVNAKSLSM